MATAAPLTHTPGQIALAALSSALQQAGQSSEPLLRHTAQQALQDRKVVTGVVLLCCGLSRYRKEPTTCALFALRCVICFWIVRCHSSLTVVPPHPGCHFLSDFTPG